MASERRPELQEEHPGIPVHRYGCGPANLADLVGDCQGSVVLDHGCGDAALKGAFVNRGAVYMGLDPFSKSADLLSAGEAIPLRDRSVDVVISNAVLEHLDDPRQACREIGRVLKPGGHLVGYVAFLENYHEFSRFHLTHQGLSLVCKDADLELTRIEVSGYGVEFQLANLLFPFGRPAFAHRFARRCLRRVIGWWLACLALGLALKRRRRKSISLASERVQLRELFDLTYASGFRFVARRNPTSEVRLSTLSAETELGDLVRLFRCPLTGSSLVRAHVRDIEWLRKAASAGWNECLVNADHSAAYEIRDGQFRLSASLAVRRLSD